MTNDNKAWPQESRSNIRSRPLVLRLKYTVDAPIKEFYNWFINFNHYGQLFDHIISITPVDESQPFAPGKQYIERAVNFMGQQEELPVLVVSVEPEKSVMVKVDNPRVRGYFEFCFVELPNDQTLFTICHYTGQREWPKIKILQWGLPVLFFFRKRTAAKRLAAIFKK